MLLYLLRHADAEILAASDHARRLTPKGEEQAQRVGKFCLREELEPSVILSSPVTRALQTAKLVARSLPDAEIIEVPWAACGMDSFVALRELEAYAKFSSVMLVGHQPDLGAMLCVLLGMTNVQSLRVRKALLSGVDVSRGLSPGQGVLEFFLPSRMM